MVKEYVRFFFFIIVVLIDIEKLPSNQKKLTNLNSCQQYVSVCFPVPTLDKIKPNFPAE